VHGRDPETRRSSATASCLYDEWGVALIGNKFLEQTAAMGTRRTADFDQLNFESHPERLLTAGTPDASGHLSPDAAKLEMQLPHMLDDQTSRLTSNIPFP